MAKITKDMMLHKAIRANPSAATIFDSHGMGCKSCSGGRVESVEWGATMHGVDIDELLAQLNRTPAAKKKKK